MGTLRNGSTPREHDNLHDDLKDALHHAEARADDAERRLQRVHQLAHVLADASGQWMWVTDASGKITEGVMAGLNFTGQRYGGTVGLTSVVGSGSTFWFTLLIAEDVN